MSGILSANLPDGWRRPDPAPWRDPAEVAVTVERLAPVAGPEVDVGAEVRGGAAFMAAIDVAHAAGMFGDLPDGCLDCGEVECACHLPHVLDLEGIADTWSEQWRSLVEADPSTLTEGATRRRAAMLAIAAHVRQTPPAVTTAERIDAVAVGVTRSARIEAAARAVVAPDVVVRAALDLWDSEADPVRARVLRDLHALRAALCSCTAHGPDLACVEHGEALAKWQARHAP